MNPALQRWPGQVIVGAASAAHVWPDSSGQTTLEEYPPDIYAQHGRLKPTLNKSKDPRPSTFI